MSFSVSFLNFLFRVFSVWALLVYVFGGSYTFAATTPTSCSTQTVYWGTISPWSSVACKGIVYGPASSGNGGTITNTNPAYTGTAKVTCNNGKWVVSGTCTKVTSSISLTSTGSNPNTSSTISFQNQTMGGSGSMVPGTVAPPNCTTPEAYYLYYNTDVAKDTYFKNQPKAHWNQFGYKEGRKSCWAPPLAIVNPNALSNPTSTQTNTVTSTQVNTSFPPTSCSTQTVYWGTISPWSSVACKGIVYGPASSGNGGTITNTNPAYTGTAKVTCNNGKWVVSGNCKSIQSNTCPMYQLANPPAGCRYEYSKDTNGCSVPKMICTNTGVLTNTGVIAPPACTSQYAPVCGQLPYSCPTGMACAQVMPQPKTYPNSCEMKKAGATFLYNGVCSSTGTGSTGAPSQTKERVTCSFSGSTTTQTCSTSIGNTPYSCSGVGSCIVYVYGTRGAKLIWKSTLGGYGYTTLDSVDERIVFTKPVTTSITTNTNGSGLRTMTSSEITSFLSRF